MDMAWTPEDKRHMAGALSVVRTGVCHARERARLRVSSAYLRGASLISSLRLAGKSSSADTGDSRWVRAAQGPGLAHSHKRPVRSWSIFHLAKTVSACCVHAAGMTQDGPDGPPPCLVRPTMHGPALAGGSEHWIFSVRVNNSI